MKRPTIDLHIEELVLRNIPHAQRHRVVAAVERELMRLLTEQGLPATLAQGANIPNMSLDTLVLRADANMDVFGTQIAQAIYGNLSNGE